MTGAGKRNHPLAYQTATKVADELGEMTETWSAATPLWSEVRTPNGREALVAQSFKAVVTHVIEVNWPGVAVLPTGRLVDSAPGPGSPAGIYNVVAAVDPDGRRRSLLIYAAEAVSPTSTDASNL